MFSLTHAHIQIHVCSGVFFSFIFFCFFGLFLYSGMLLPSQTLNTLDWGGVCVGGWRGCFNAFISGWHRIPPQYYIICTCTQCVFVCVHRGNHTCLLNVNSWCWQYLKMAKHEEPPPHSPPPQSMNQQSFIVTRVKSNSVAKTVLYFCILCLKHSSRDSSLKNELCHHSLTVMLFETCMTFISSVKLKKTCVEECWDPNDIGPRWLTLLG